MELDWEKVKETIEKKFKVDYTPVARTFILPDGSFVHLDSYHGHQEVNWELQASGFTNEEADIGVNGAIRVNFDTEGFIALPNVKNLTSAQYDSLTKEFDTYLPKWRSWSAKYGTFMIIEPCTYEEKQGGYPSDLFHYYVPNKYNTDDYIDIIKTFYRTGVLVEDISLIKDKKRSWIDDIEINFTVE